MYRLEKLLIVFEATSYLHYLPDSNYGKSLLKMLKVYFLNRDVFLYPLWFIWTILFQHNDISNVCYLSLLDRTLPFVISFSFILVTISFFICLIKHIKVFEQEKTIWHKLRRIEMWACIINSFVYRIPMYDITYTTYFLKWCLQR